MFGAKNAEIGRLQSEIARYKALLEDERGKVDILRKQCKDTEARYDDYLVLQEKCETQREIIADLQEKLQTANEQIKQYQDNQKTIAAYLKSAMYGEKGEMEVQEWSATK